MVGLFFNRIVESGRLADDPVVITIKPGKHPYLTLGLRNEYGRQERWVFIRLGTSHLVSAGIGCSHFFQFGRKKDIELC